MEKQSLTSLPKASQGLPLAESKGHRAKLDKLLLACFSVQKLYGRDVGNADTITEVFHSMLSGFPADRVVRAFETWMERSQEFPTPADLISLIRRNGKPPLKESEIIAIRKKDGQDRTPDDWATLREWDADQREGWKDFNDPVKDKALQEENIRLRQKTAGLEQEVRRLTEMLHEVRTAKGLERPKPSMQEKVANTVNAMRSAGAPESDIEAFMKEYEVAA